MLPLGQMDLIKVEEGAVWALPTTDWSFVLRDCESCMQGMENRKVIAEPFLLGDAKLIQMNQRGFFSLQSSKSSLFHNHSRGFKASKMLTLFTPIRESFV